ncbi:hypothetical protein LT493_17105 [Streptomyces tricolor]|nr:hypothetical protein [Streptomyces tricolor]
MTAPRTAARVPPPRTSSTTATATAGRAVHFSEQAAAQGEAGRDGAAAGGERQAEAAQSDERHVDPR